jgi:putative ABC transport system permease protein
LGLHGTPAGLLRPRAPKPGKLILLERVRFLWKRLSFTSKVTARNLFRYKRRLFMTIVGIMGCTALLLTGFGIRDSIKTIVEFQFGKIYLYQISVSAKDDISTASFETLKSNVETTLGVQSIVPSYVKMMDFNKQGSDSNTQISLTVFADGTDPTPWIRIQDLNSQKLIPLPESGAVVDVKLAKDMGIKTGDIIQMQDGNLRYPIKVVAFCENYIRHVAYMSAQAYREATGKQATMDHFFIDVTPHADLQALGANLLAIKDVGQVSAYTQATESLNDAIQGLDGVVIVLILAAAALAFVVMYNLTNINLGERIREIATLKVLGFNRLELAEYVFRENVLLSLLGVIVGCGAGILLHRFVMSTVEVEGMMFGRQISPMSFVLSIGLTLVFTTIVNFVMLPRLNKIDMVESLKTVE